MHPKSIRWSIIFSNEASIVFSFNIINLSSSNKLFISKFVELVVSIFPSLRHNTVFNCSLSLFSSNIVFIFNTIVFIFDVSKSIVVKTISYSSKLIFLKLKLERVSILGLFPISFSTLIFNSFAVPRPVLHIIAIFFIE